MERRRVEKHNGQADELYEFYWRNEKGDGKPDAESATDRWKADQPEGRIA